MKKTIKMGVFGLGRGKSFYDNIIGNGGEVVAVCDMSEAKRAEAKEILGDGVTAYADFDGFINHQGLEAVLLCNYFHEHTPYAIRALEKNIHVLSECTSNATMAQGVELVRAAEKSKAFYMISENYPFMKMNCEMTRICRGGTLGKILYATGEYNHPVDPHDQKELPTLRPFPKHWRNLLPRTYYVTHSLAPLMYMTGAVPTRVTALPVYHPFPEDSILHTGVQDRAAVINSINNDGSVFTFTGCAAFGAHGNSYRICGEKGQVENIRGEKDKIMLRYNSWNVPEGKEKVNAYYADWVDEDKEKIEASGHGGGDFLVIREFFTCIRENKRPVMDVYFATTMASVGILAHRSMLEGGVPYDIPDFRREEDRKQYENDHITPFYGTDGSEPTIACDSHPNTMTDEEKDALYERVLGKKEN